MIKVLVFFKNLKFRKKLVFSYIIVVIIPLLTLGIYSYSQAKYFLLQQERMNLTESIRKVADNVNYRFAKYDTVIESITFNKRIIQMFNTKYKSVFPLYEDLTQTLEPLFSTIQTLNNDIKQITIYTGSDIASGINSIQPIDSVKDEYWFPKAIKSNETGWYFDNGKLYGIRKLMEQYKSPIHNLLYLEIFSDHVFNNAINIESRNYGMFITDSSQNIIYSSENIERNRAGIEKELVKFETGSVKISGMNLLLIKEEISVPEWTIYYYKPVSSIVINARNILSVTILIIFTCMIILIFLIWIFSATLVKRIEDLNKKVKLAAGGNLKIEISSKSRDEIGELTNGVGNMLKSINTLIEEVYHSKIVQKEAEMKALQAQINPHFLYNTLSLINWMAIRIKASKISHITETLATFYRTTLNKGRNVIPTRDEIENIKAYINIQLIMHDNSFDVVYNIDEEIYEYSMINLLLQPVVENAIYHGIDHKTDGRGKIKISGSLTGDLVEFAIEDNGPGMDEVMMNQVLSINSKGYGIKNVNDRIKLFFGEQYGVSISSNRDSGTYIKVKLPKYIGDIPKDMKIPT